MEEEAGLADIFGASSEAQEAPKIEYHYAQYRRNVATTETDDLITLQMVKKHALWGDHLWNGGCWLARHLDSHPGLVCGKRVAELGAGAGLPSVIACRLGASRVVCTDYPDSELIDNIATNLRTNCPGQENRAIARGYLWGDAVEEAFEKEHSYDLVFLCDLIFNHSEHAKLVTSTLRLLNPQTGTAFCVFTHYRPWLVEKDLAFLSAEDWQAAGWKWTEIAEERVPLMFEADRGDAEIRSTVHAYQLERLPI